MLDSRDRWVSSALWANAMGRRPRAQEARLHMTSAYGISRDSLDEIAYLNADKNKSSVSRKLRAHNTYDGWPRAQEDTHNAHREQM